MVVLGRKNGKNLGLFDFCLGLLRFSFGAFGGSFLLGFGNLFGECFDRFVGFGFPVVFGNPWKPLRFRP